MPVICSSTEHSSITVIESEFFPALYKIRNFGFLFKPGLRLLPNKSVKILQTYFVPPEEVHVLKLSQIFLTTKHFQNSPSSQVNAASVITFGLRFLEIWVKADSHGPSSKPTVLVTPGSCPEGLFQLTLTLWNVMTAFLKVLSDKCLGCEQKHKFYI